MNQAMGQLLDDYELDRVPDRVPVTSIGPQVNHDHTHEKNVFLGENHFFGVINQNDSALPFMFYVCVFHHISGHLSRQIWFRKI